MTCDQNKIIQGLWIGGSLSTLEQLSVRSFLENGHEYHLYVYDDVKNIPQGTVIKDANEILARNKIFVHQYGPEKGGVAAFSDLFRYHLLYKKGGWWVDTDVICLRYFDHKKEEVVCSSFEPPWGELPNSCILKFTKNSFFLKLIVDHCASIDLQAIGFGQIGPLLIQRLIRELKLEEYVVPYFHFNPIGWKYVAEHIAYKNKPLKMKVKELLRPFIKPSSMKGRKIEKGSYSVHLWNEMWRLNGLDKEGRYNQCCLYEQLKRRYL